MSDSMMQADLWGQFDAASALAQAGQWRAAIPLFETALTADAPVDLRAHILNDLGVAHQSLGDLPAALSCFRQAWELYQREKNTLGAAIALGNLGTAHVQAREWDDAVLCFDRCLLVFENLKVNNLAVAKMRVDMGDALTATGKPKAACEQYELALQVQTTAGDSHAAALTWHALGVALRARNRFEDGITAFERSSALFAELADHKNLSVTLNRLGELHYERRDYANAIETFQRDLSISERLQNQPATAQALNNLALAYLAEKDLAQSAACLQRAVPIWEKIDEPFGLAMALWARAQLYLEQNETEQALKAGQQAEQLCERLKRSSEATAVRKWLAAAKRGKRGGLRRYF